MTTSIWLDYGRAASKNLLGNISAAADDGERLWTASDEGRTVECLTPFRDGYRLERQVALDRSFRIPGKAEGSEIDIESLAVAGGRLWFSGSHCRVRRDHQDRSRVDPVILDRPSRCCLGALSLPYDDAHPGRGHGALPFAGPGRLRSILGRNPYLAPFMALPCKENGLDIEGLCIIGERLFLGLRGPVVNSIALAVEFQSDARKILSSGKSKTHFLDLDGLGIRELARGRGDTIWIMAGPVSAANGPFHLYRWQPEEQRTVQTPELVHHWREDGEHPEGLCRLKHQGREGLLVVYDSPGKTRISGSRYRADWLAIR